MTFLQDILKLHPVRKTETQKNAFRGWAMKQMRAMGYQPRVETDGRLKHQNIVAGEPSRAKVLFIAGYDTPARSLLPMLVFPRNLPLSFSYFLLNVLLLLLLPVAVLLVVQGFWGIPRLSYLAMIVTYLAELALKMIGPANPNNANRSTGPAALLELMSQIPEEDRGKVAFILFDHSSLERMGSKAWAKTHAETQYTRLTVCLSDLGVGKDLLLISRSLARKTDCYPQLEQALADPPGRTAHFYKAAGSAVTSDHGTFHCGSVLTACKASTGIGYYIPALATVKDTEADPENISFAAGALADFVHRAFGPKTAETEESTCP